MCACCPLKHVPSLPVRRLISENAIHAFRLRIIKPPGKFSCILLLAVHSSVSSDSGKDSVHEFYIGGRNSGELSARTKLL